MVTDSCDEAFLSRRGQLLTGWRTARAARRNPHRHPAPSGRPVDTGVARRSRAGSCRVPALAGKSFVTDRGRPARGHQLDLRSAALPESLVRLEKT